MRRRDQINKVIDALINQGYLLKKKPLLVSEDRRSYLNNYSYIDPGILEAKAGIDRSQVDTSLLVDFIRSRGAAFGIVAYGGLPYWDKRNRVMYWPYWLI